MIIEYFYSKFLEVYDREDLGCLVWSIFRGGVLFQADRNGRFRNHAPRLVDQDGACI